MRLFSFYTHASDVGETHGLVPTTLQPVSRPTFKLGSPSSSTSTEFYRYIYLFDPIFIVEWYFVESLSPHVCVPKVAVTKLHVSRSQKNITTLQHEQRSPGEWRQLRPSSVATLAMLYWWLRAARKGGRGEVKSFRGLEAPNLLTAIIMHYFS
jgi:hypothetical protein